MRESFSFCYNTLANSRRHYRNQKKKFGIRNSYSNSVINYKNSWRNSLINSWKLLFQDTDTNNASVSYLLFEGRMPLNNNGLACNAAVACYKNKRNKLLSRINISPHIICGRTFVLLYLLFNRCSWYFFIYVYFNIR